MVGISSLTMSWTHVLALDTVLLKLEFMTADDIRYRTLELENPVCKSIFACWHCETLISYSGIPGYYNTFLVLFFSYARQAKVDDGRLSDAKLGTISRAAVFIGGWHNES